MFDEVRPADRAGAGRGRRTQGVTDSYELQQVIRRVVGGWVGGKLRRRPMIIPMVIDA